MSLSICPCVELHVKVLLDSHPEHRPSLCVSHSFRQYQIILLCYRGNGLLEGFYIQQHRDPELTPCQRETDLLYQTQHEIQITAGSGSMNESLIDTVGCLRSIDVCLCFPFFHNVHTPKSNHTPCFIKKQPGT